ncbi:hypothetical protein C7441_112191 [Pseudaminobacter salicylatoxidans]|uniref:Uncharacterized protein n=1 Tax=Pseudaminobacter salicylatoxidans TaxID=93369 RepID=A0A316CLH8_PSESE|nr:hypothetical protein [Pseudaminobacter salicylatoxidans]PWJ80649.1 hypothetical protein C7441_112191 [Pseudaminobacter salicylatoxidans]
MADFFTPAQIEHLSQSTVRLDLLVEFQFTTGTVRVWNGNTELPAGGKTWKPMYGSGQIDGLSMPTGGTAEAVNFTVSGIPGDSIGLLAKALEESPTVTQQLVTVYLQLFDADWQTFGAPIGIWWGFMQPPRVNRSQMQDTEGAVQTVTMTAENAFFNRSRPPYGRYTDRDQQKRSPGDKFFQFTPSLLFKTFQYPRW